MGEMIKAGGSVVSERIGVDTFGGKVHVEWDPQAAVTPLGQLPFFIEFLKVSGLFEHFIEGCPLEYTSPNAPLVRDVLGTLMLSILAGHNRYAHISSIRFDGVNPGLLGMEELASLDQKEWIQRNEHAHFISGGLLASSCKPKVAGDFSDSGIAEYRRCGVRLDAEDVPVGHKDVV